MSKKMMSRREYLRWNGRKCPACQSTNMTSGETQYPSTVEITQGMTCQSCGASWVELYKLTGYADLELGDTGLFCGVGMRELSPAEQKAFDSMVGKK